MKDKTRTERGQDAGLASYYDRHGVLNEIVADDVTLSLDGVALRHSGRRTPAHT
jgi:hypothetical protein